MRLRSVIFASVLLCCAFMVFLAGCETPNRYVHEETTIQRDVYEDTTLWNE